MVGCRDGPLALSFVTTFAITMFYVSFANKKLDPPAEAIRERLQAESEGHRS